MPAGCRLKSLWRKLLPVTRSDPDYYTLNLGSQVLGGAFYASRLSRDLRENSGLVYSVSSTLEAEATGAFYVMSYGCDPRNVSKVRSIVERDLKEMQTVCRAGRNAETGQGAASPANFPFRIQCSQHCGRPDLPRDERPSAERAARGCKYVCEDHSPAGASCFRQVDSTT